MNIWEILGIEPTWDQGAVRRAYAAAAARYNPEEHPEEFLAVRQAYEQALAFARSAEEPVEVPELAELTMPTQPLPAMEPESRTAGTGGFTLELEPEGSSQPEIIINPRENFDAKFDYYMEAYDDDLILIAAKGKKDIRITAAGQGNSFEDIECQLIGEKGKGWRELIAAAIDKVYENMIANTPPTTEEERTHCEMIKEAVKGMFINESRTAAEAEFIKTHIVDYEKIFDVCMNGDDLEFKKGLVRLQKMQNEYVMQREREETANE